MTAMDEKVTREIERLTREIDERRARVTALIEEDAAKRVTDLEAFEKMSPEEQAGLHEANPAHYRRMMDLVREKNERALFEGKTGVY